MNNYSRKIDELGRIILPLELRQQLNWEQKDILQVSIKGDTIVLEKSLSPQKQ